MDKIAKYNHKKDKREDFYNLVQLKDRLWTKYSIDKWLDKPDRLAVNPVRKNAPPSKLYLTSRIHDIEKREDFLEWLEKSLATRKKRAKLKEEREQAYQAELLKCVEEVEVEIPTFSKEELYVKAVEHYNHLCKMRGEFDSATINDNVIFLNRISTNMIRHLDSVKYQEKLDEVFSKLGGYDRDAYILVKNKINKAIFHKYPFLNNKDRPCL